MSFYRSGLGDAVWLTLPLQFLVSLNNLGGREKSKDLIIFVKQRTYQHLHFSKADLVSSLECGCGHALCGSRGGAASSRDTDRHHGHNVAGHAIALASVLVTNNERRFSQVTGLKVENWTRRQDNLS
jgi:hypothetical protein